ncbi:MAG: hypothetical protein DRP64_03120 [Verrucomicrobia bacterium]|nr:MAG: hypothetical protein DRP64_03120 [Verrucomicrobiota bacterium]
MKKCLILSALMAVACTVQAKSIHWVGTVFDGAATDSWTDPISWADPNNGNAIGVPGAGDDVIIQRGVYGGPFDTVVMPVLSSTAAVNTMAIAFNGDGSFLDSQLDMVAGADLTLAGNIEMAGFLNSTATLNLSGDAVFTSFGLIMGNGNSSTSTIYMSETSSVDIVTLVIGFGAGASRSIIMDGEATFRAQAVDPSWVNTLIVALNTNSGDFILATDIGGGITEYSVVVVPPDYANWVADWGLTGADTNRFADIENGGLGDGMENQLEYVLGGNPTNDDAVIILPTAEFTMDTIEYVYRRRVDATLRGLDYGLLTIDDLQVGTWTTNGTAFEVAPVGIIDADFESVTNSIPITGFDLGFVNLEVTEN